MTFEIIPKEAEAHLDWHGLIDALRAGHRLPKAEIGDTFLYRGKDTLLSRAAWIDGGRVSGENRQCLSRQPRQGRTDDPWRGEPLPRW